MQVREKEEKGRDGRGKGGTGRIHSERDEGRKNYSMKERKHIYRQGKRASEIM